MSVEALIARYGLAAIGLGAAIEGETVVATGGLLAHQGLVPLWGVIAAAGCGTFLADQVFYLLGRHYRDHPRVARIAAKPAFARALRLLQRHPTGFIFAFRFAIGFRTVSPVAIGAAGVPPARFVPLNALAAAVWAGTIAGLGYGFAHAITLAIGRLRAVEHYALAIAAVALAAGAAGWWASRRLLRGRQAP